MQQHSVLYFSGFFEFRLCAHNNIHTRVSQQCLDQNVLVIEEGEQRGHPHRFFPSKYKKNLDNFIFDILNYPLDTLDLFMGHFLISLSKLTFGGALVRCLF